MQLVVRSTKEVYNIQPKLFVEMFYLFQYNFLVYNQRILQDFY